MSTFFLKKILFKMSSSYLKFIKYKLNESKYSYKIDYNGLYYLNIEYEEMSILKNNDISYFQFQLLKSGFPGKGRGKMQKKIIKNLNFITKSK